jgi:hypothetical protein
LPFCISCGTELSGAYCGNCGAEAATATAEGPAAVSQVAGSAKKSLKQHAKRWPIQRTDIAFLGVVILLGAALLVASTVLSVYIAAKGDFDAMVIAYPYVTVATSSVIYIPLFLFFLELSRNRRLFVVGTRPKVLFAVPVATVVILEALWLFGSLYAYLTPESDDPQRGPIALYFTLSSVVVILALFGIYFFIIMNPRFRRNVTSEATKPAQSFGQLRMLVCKTIFGILAIFAFIFTEQMGVSPAIGAGVLFVVMALANKALNSNANITEDRLLRDDSPL